MGTRAVSSLSMRRVHRHFERIESWIFPLSRFKFIRRSTSEEVRTLHRTVSADVRGFEMRRWPIHRACRYDSRCLSHSRRLKADSHIACRAHAVPLPCGAAKGLECVFPIWFKQCGRVWFTLTLPRLYHAQTMLFFSRPHSTASGDGLWATCPRSASSGYNLEFHEDCYQKHTSPHNDPYLRL
jgi:hypothetical protein